MGPNGNVQAQADHGTAAGPSSRQDRLEAALEYLLISQMNAMTPALPGPESHAALLEFYFGLLTGIKPQYFFDIGAHDAATACHVKRLLPACDVTAFEANPLVHRTHHAKAAGGGVAYVNAAVAAQDGVATIYAPVTLSNGFAGGEIVPMLSEEPLETGKSSLLRRNEDATYRQHFVRTVALDSIAANLPGTPDARDVALWIDVEGAAAAVLAGAARTLARTAIIFIETENHPFWVDQKTCWDVARILIAAGFFPVKRDREYGDKQFNTVFLHHRLADLLYPKTYKAAPVPRTSDQPVPSALSVAPLPVTAPAGTPRSYHSLAACLVAEIPVFVPVFNNPTYAANMLRQLKGLGIRNIFMVDNASTMPEMSGFLDHVSREATVIRLPENKGPYDLVLSETNYACLPDIFCVTDPDLEFNANMPADFLFDLLNLTNKFQAGKVGLALDLSDRHKMHDEKYLYGEHYYHIWEWEGQFWQDPVDRLADGTTIFKAKIDTTFALYNKKYFNRETFWDAFRIAGPYTCRHLPWYKESGLPAAEEEQYRSTQKFSYYMV